MKRKINKVFRALSKKGMTRAFIETEKREFVYPVISLNYKTRTGKNKFYIYILAAVLLAVTGFLLLNKDKQTETDKPLASNRQTKTNKTDETKSIDGLSGLHYAVIQGDPHWVRSQIRKGVNIDSRDSYGWTALHWATFREDESMCRILLTLHASTSIRSTRQWFKYPAGATAADIASIKKNSSLKALLNAPPHKPGTASVNKEENIEENTEENSEENNKDENFKKK
jgi:ankyrin repeat protein